ncbi:cardiolipin synthase [Sphingomonas abietis]|uniref:Cardiolipin synthase n=1 Tax=Sphingomonas abietis TaxID=3012344 RepID=A0ABY7NVD1_9SPHN|nr:cardiolipin synthase [Sphingomonas abietis]WBO23406.1 cardiolipin synthase [Sphingomonas abietis]
MTGHPDFETIYYACEWAVRIGALAVVPLRRTPAATRSWLLLIFFLPIPGLLLFLAIGSPRFPAWREKRFKALLPFFTDIATRQKGGLPISEDHLSIAALAEKLGHMPATSGNNCELLDDYDGVIDRLVADIGEARHTVHLLVYIFADDATGRRVIAALADARRRGVECRVMLDSVGSARWRKGAIRLLSEADVEVREALPFHVIHNRTRRDMRNHRKLFLIDGVIGYAGSQNIVDKDFRTGVVNHELAARVTGPVVASMVALVEADWSLETGTPPDAVVTIPPVAGQACAQLLPSGADYPLEGFETLLVWQLHRAEHHVIVATPYFIPDEDVLGAMRTAVARGVTVDLVVSAVVDQPLVSLAQCSYYDDLLKAGIRVNLFRDYLLHAKNVSIDDRFAIVGSSNVDLRSFQLNEEASLLLLDASSVAAVRAIQQGYIDGSDKLDLATWRQRPLVRRLIENIAALVSSLL